MLHSAAALKLENSELTEQSDTSTFLGHSAIYGISHWAPSTRKSSQEVEAEITQPLTNALEIEERIGVRERRIASGDESITDMAIAAIETLKSKGTLNGNPVVLDDVDLLIYFSVAREVAEPATAVFIQNRLGLEKCIAFDVSNACLGFIDAWCIADAMIATGKVKKALLVSAERISGISDSAISEINRGENPALHYAALSLGDGACAALIGPKTKGSRTVELIAGTRETYGKFSGFCILPSLTQPMLTQAGRLFNVALSKFPKLVKCVLSRSNWETDEIDRYIAHQASLPSIRKGAESIDVPFEKTFNTIEEYGNMASVSVPFSLSKLLATQKNWEKQKILVLGFGSGLGVGVLSLECK